MEKKKFIILFTKYNNCYWIFEKEDFKKDGFLANECAFSDAQGNLHIFEYGREVLESL